MAKRIIFIGDGVDEEIGGSIHFVGNAIGSDYTLCGLTMDGDTGTVGGYDATNKLVNCERCKDIVRYCKKIKLTELSKAKREF